MVARRRRGRSGRARCGEGIGRGVLGGGRRQLARMQLAVWVPNMTSQIGR